MTKQCKMCGLCCKVHIGRTEFKDLKMAQWRKNTFKIVKWKDTYYVATMNGCSRQLPNNKCSVQDRKPQQCKDFPKGEEMLAVWKLVNPECGMC
jgi:Fe-S-cluster containining protein